MLTGRSLVPVLSVRCESKLRYSNTDALDSNVKSWKYSSRLNIAAVWGDETVAGNQRVCKSCLGWSSIWWHSQKSRVTLWMPLMLMTTKASPGARLGLTQGSPREWPSCICRLICFRLMDVKNVPVHSYEVNIFSNMISTQPDWYSPRYNAGAFTHSQQSICPPWQSSHLIDPLPTSHWLHASSWLPRPSNHNSSSRNVSRSWSRHFLKLS